MAAPRMPQPDARHLRAMVDSFDLHLRIEDKSEKTREEYTAAAIKFGGWLVAGRPDPAGMLRYVAEGTDQAGGSSPVLRQGTGRPIAKWTAVVKVDIQEYVLFLKGWGYADGMVNNQFRALQQFFKWLSDEEGCPDPFATLKPPKIAETLPPMLDTDELALLIGGAEADKTYRGKRDTAILRLYASTGARLSELALAVVDDVNLAAREMVVHGKGNKDRKVKFDFKATRALDRYLRARAEYLADPRRPARKAPVAALWVGRGAPMTPSGIRQAIERRADAVGLKVNPHMFRHMFSHGWLDKGGAEGDLMELTGWTSPQMLRRYGRSARSARAMRAYDRIDVMDGI